MSERTRLTTERRAGTVVGGDVLVNDRQGSEARGKRWKVTDITSMPGPAREDLLHIFTLDDGSRQARLANEYVTLDHDADGHS